MKLWRGCLGLLLALAVVPDSMERSPEATRAAATSSISAWSVAGIPATFDTRGLALRGFRMDLEAPAATPTMRAGRVELVRSSGLVEWYAKRGDALEQGFTIRERPAGDLVLRLKVDSAAEAREIDDGLAFGNVRYTHLAAFDAKHASLPAGMHWDEAGKAIELRIAAGALARAEFPVSIDPLISGSACTVDADCNSGVCEDGVCCATRCAACKSCDATGTSCTADEPAGNLCDVAPVAQGFESGTSGWTLTGSWGRSTETHYGGSYGLTDSPGAADVAYSDTWAIAPSLNLQSASAPTLSFYHYHYLYSGNDSARVEVSTNGGTSWTLLGSAYTGSASYTTQATLSLSAYRGYTDVRVRFRLIVGSASSSSRGWWIDDVSFGGGALASTACAACDGAGSCSAVPVDDAACGAIDCDGLDFSCADYADLGAGRCEGFGDCKDANTSDCSAFTPSAAGIACDADSSYDFETAPLNWTLTGAWARTTSQARNGSYSLTDSPSGNYDPKIGSGYAQLPPIKVKAQGSPQLSFAHKRAFWVGSSTDSGMVQVSSDNGATWVYLGYWSGTSDWTSESISLDALRGQTILIRFALSTSYWYSEGADGWYLDDVRVTGTDSQCTACDGAGSCSAPLDDDPECGTIECDGIDTQCSDYHDMTANRCVAFNACRAPNSSQCVEVTQHGVETLCDDWPALGMEQDTSGFVLTGTWARTNATAKSGSYSLTESPSGYYAGETGNARMAAFSLEGTSAPALTFWHRHHFYYVSMYSGYNDTGEVQILGDPGYWQTLTTYRGSADWTKQTISLADYAGQKNIQIRFVVTDYSSGGTGDGWNLDDVKLTGVSTACTACNGAGSCAATPSDDAACGTIECDGLDGCVDYNDLTQNRCDAFAACKQPNSADCDVHVDLPQGSACAVAPLFADGFEGGGANWTLSSPWAARSQDGEILPRTGTGFLTDSPGASSPRGANFSATLNQTIDLRGAPRPALEFWYVDSLLSYCWRSNCSYDYFLVEASTDDGASWSEVARWTDHGVSDWTFTSISLAAFAERTIRLRLRMANSSSSSAYSGATSAGIWIDDLRVVGGYDSACAQCDGAGSCSVAPEDDAACGAIDCDSLDDSCADYADLTALRCEGLGNCKDANEYADCSLHEDQAAGTACAMLPAFRDGFEKGSGGWTLAGGWGVTDAEAQRDTHALAYGKTGATSSGGANMTSYVDLSGAVAPRLTFWHRHELGEAQVLLYAHKEGDNYYSYGSYYPRLTTLRTFRGSQAEWREETVDLSDYRGSKVQFQLWAGTTLPEYYFVLDELQVHTREEACVVCDGSGACDVPVADDERCGVLDCDALDSSCRDYADLGQNRCEGAGNCKDANDASDCSAYEVAPADTACGEAPLRDDFETEQPDRWKIQGPWQRTTERAASGSASMALVMEDYAATSGSLELAFPVDVSSATAATLSFRHLYSFDDMYGGVEVSINDSEWYGLQNFGGESYNPYASELTWKQEEIDLSDYVEWLGTNVRVRFRVPADGDGYASHWYVDDVVLQLHQDEACLACDEAGVCSVPLADDARCGEVDCDGLDTTCRNFADLDEARCGGAGRCAAANDPATCTSFDDAQPGTLCTDSEAIRDDFELASERWDVDYYFKRRAGSSHSGGYALISTPYSQTSVTLNEALDLRGADEPTLTFWHSRKLSWSNSAFVQVSLDGGDTFETIATYYGNYEEFEQETVSLQPYAGVADLRVRFTHEPATSNEQWRIDDVVIDRNVTTACAACDGSGACTGVAEDDPGNCPAIDCDALDTPCADYADYASNRCLAQGECVSASPELCTEVSYPSDPCDDGDACTAEDACADGVCLPGSLVDCDDQDPCTDDACDSASGCVHALNTAACDDGDPCSVQDQCSDGACLGSARDCDDHDTCTADACDPLIGCVNEPALHCDDGNPCTADSCDPEEGCRHDSVADHTPCSDGDTCNGAELCSAGHCVAGTPLDCEDYDPCTIDACSATQGCKNQPAEEGASCSDGRHCDGVCSGGECTGGTPLDCSDGDPCTYDVCEPTAMLCLHTVMRRGASCDDEDACTEGEQCDDARTCVGMPIDDCDEDEEPDAGERADAGTAEDAGASDAGVDADSFDAGQVDAGAAEQPDDDEEPQVSDDQGDPDVEVPDGRDLPEPPRDMDMASEDMAPEDMAPEDMASEKSGEGGASCAVQRRPGSAGWPGVVLALALLCRRIRRHRRR